ncbi:hypothetical protein EQW78_06335 [Oerskovia turbata]|uniref:Uncharacterized protein n=1 Tax=Oerskovia turbata TaxID=1713 RepID=A0A4Q1KYB5_9CELL|nr:hypothetical protein [Oerskovia turbata]RXR25071.1 hypothetical protein EQW73_12365 [Oerskovia turbata]RXR35217.1 hypothetical protein EQW78_06335 [Oerskovia turbata]TGJ96454.1 hypothetical protein DLJ96_12195 [Actinotalea fermentans ATCC 43279 = JCM 9966 = DSM 3133]
MSALITTVRPLPAGRRALLALSLWGPRQYGVAAVSALGVALLLGVSTVLVPNPFFSREIAVVPWNYPVWIATSLLAGMLVGTYVRGGPAPGGAPAPGGTPGGAAGDESQDAPPAETRDRSGALGMAGGVLAWFAVGCPVCNKLALLALGYSGAITWFAPVQPFLGIVSLLLTGVALFVRLANQVACPVRPAAARA